MWDVAVPTSIHGELNGHCLYENGSKVFLVAKDGFRIRSENKQTDRIEGLAIDWSIVIFVQICTAQFVRYKCENNREVTRKVAFFFVFENIDYVENIYDSALHVAAILRSLLDKNKCDCAIYFGHQRKGRKGVVQCIHRFVDGFSLPRWRIWRVYLSQIWISISKFLSQIIWPKNL